MGANRRKAIRDRKKHRARTEELRSQRRASRAKAVANRLLGGRIIGIDLATGRPTGMRTDGTVFHLRTKDEEGAWTTTQLWKKQ